MVSLKKLAVGLGRRNLGSARKLLHAFSAAPAHVGFFDLLDHLSVEPGPSSLFRLKLRGSPGQSALFGFSLLSQVPPGSFRVSFRHFSRPQRLWIIFPKKDQPPKKRVEPKKAREALGAFCFIRMVELHDSSEVEPPSLVSYDSHKAKKYSWLQSINYGQGYSTRTFYILREHGLTTRLNQGLLTSLLQRYFVATCSKLKNN